MDELKFESEDLYNSDIDQDDSTLMADRWWHSGFSQDMLVLIYISWKCRGPLLILLAIYDVLVYKGHLSFQRDFIINWAPSSEFVSSSIPSWQILTGHAQPFRGARDLGFCLKVPLDSLLIWASSGGSGETVQIKFAWRSPIVIILRAIMAHVQPWV